MGPTEQATYMPRTQRFCKILVSTFIHFFFIHICSDTDDGNYSATAYWDNEMGYTIDFWGQGSHILDIPRGVARAHYDPHVQETG